MISRLCCVIWLLYHSTNTCTFWLWAWRVGWATAQSQDLFRDVSVPNDWRKRLFFWNPPNIYHTWTQNFRTPTLFSLFSKIQYVHKAYRNVYNLKYLKYHKFAVITNTTAMQFVVKNETINFSAHSFID